MIQDDQLISPSVFKNCFYCYLMDFSALLQSTSPPRTPQFYQNFTNYTNHVANTQEGQRLHTEIRCELVNHRTVKGLVKFCTYS